MGKGEGTDGPHGLSAERVESIEVDRDDEDSNLAIFIV